MQASQRVRPPSSRFDGHWRSIGSFVLGALLVAIIKPWSADTGPAVARLTPSPSPGPSASWSPEVGFSSREYDPSIFGNHEPSAVWAIWPAGYLVTFGFVVQVPGAQSPAPQGLARPSSGPGATSAATPGASGASPQTPTLGAAGDPVWPSGFDVPEGNHLLLIGINMPRGYSVSSVRLELHAAGSLLTVGIDRLRSPWPDHFAVIGIPTGSGDGRLNVWPPGLYQLDLKFNPGGISRSFEIRIAGSTEEP